MLATMLKGEKKVAQQQQKLGCFSLFNGQVKVIAGPHLVLID